MAIKNRNLTELLLLLLAVRSAICSTELAVIGYQSGADNSKIRIVIAFVVYKDGESDKKGENAE